ncbi:Winged helix-turn-helix transcription repressor DNA-binding [Penicillium soppii]|uniref:Winged helix-turn-helix transcription repressor DNA-binding n=1 Tax=Penicillium soppii TaxID=69789 RepID=UPI0025481880|nr:Winged helix-turn-helix transcription repressor DNA-binding [Penicillium soppii]KAJ5864832.1 Winged helix-turn-helix transcription repressor DNA-binding [Penicillium soppii]
MALTTKPMATGPPAASTSPTPEKALKPLTINEGEDKSLQPTIQIKKYLHRISLHPTLTPYRRRVYRTLLSVPPGRWTTYSAMAAYLGSSARAVGNAMRSNPFAPEVPCHRVLAADGSLGGYKGEWKVDGHKAGGGFCEEKMLRLEEEGVTFLDGKVRGICFKEFVDFGVK